MGRGRQEEMERERRGEEERREKEGGREIEINFKELAHMIVGAGKSEIHSLFLSTHSVNNLIQSLGAKYNLYIDKCQTYLSWLDLSPKLQTIFHAYSTSVANPVIHYAVYIISSYIIKTDNLNQDGESVFEFFCYAH